MKNHRVKILLLATVLVSGVLAVVCARREPSADGRTLSEWITLAHEQPSGRDATNAVRTIGAKAVPVLLGKLRSEDPSWKRLFDNNWGRKFFDDEWLYTARFDHFAAKIGFSILGTQAVTAIPELSRMLYDTNKDTLAGQALGFIGPDSLPVLKEALTNADVRIRERATRGIIAREDVARLAMPEILAARHDSNPRIPMIVLIHLPAALPKEECWPVAVEFLRDSRPQMLGPALRLLGQTTTNPALSVPLVLPFLTNTYWNTRAWATGTLVVLDPAIAAMHGVNTNLYSPNGNLK